MEELGERKNDIVTARGDELRRVTQYERFVKPTLDRFLGFVLGVLTLPALAMLWALARIALGRPAIESIPCVGIGGTQFNLYKLRTSGAHTGDMRGRRRKFAHFLREWSLDELPQLWNVALGHMSMVGPRPIPPEMASDLTEWERRRHEVKPGLTGQWQVEARGDGRDVLDNIHIDIQYIDQLSFSTDLRILLQTLSAVAFKREREESEKPRPPRLRSRLPHIRLIVMDGIVWLLALTLAAATRLDFSWRAINKAGLAWAILLAIGLQLAWGFGVGMYRGRWRLASYEEVTWVAAGTGLVTVVLFATTLPTGHHIIPRGAILAGAAFQLVGALTVRYAARAVYTAQGKSRHKRRVKMLVFGAGEAGMQAALAIWKDDEADALPVAFLDDNPQTWRRRPLGLPVVGDRTSIAGAAKRYNADTLLIAMPSAPGQVIGEVAEIAQRAKLGVRILPRLAKFVDGSDGEILVSDIRKLTLSDFLDRDEVNLDLDQIAGYLKGKKVLVTGAGGSIGSVLCRIIEQFQPKKLYKLDHDENALHSLQLSLEGRALLDSDDLILCDIRDRDALLAAMREVQPEVVFHTAAHKHLTFLERHPEEATKTNVIGTLNVLEAAAEVEAERVVNVSTDKAADPQSVLGITKRIGEMLTAHFGNTQPGVFMSVRFGNVLGSRGSVVPVFRSQIESGEPITITDPDVTRYFMTIEEACQLVVQAGAMDGRGDLFVLDMGKPVRIVELAQRLQNELRPGVPANIVFTGLRPGEKLHETLVGADDVLIDRPHELITRYQVPSVSPGDLELSGVRISWEALTTALSLNG